MVYSNIKKKHIGVIGGGIAGLYAARELIRKGYHVTLFEKNNDLGGRICTASSSDGILYEGGAGRFHHNHHRLINMLKEYGLYDKLIPNDKRRIFIRDNKVFDFDLNKQIAFLINEGSKKTRRYLQQRSLLAFMYEVMPPSIIEDTIHAFGYVSEFDTCNAYDSLRVFQKEFRDTIDYYSLRGGLSSLVRAIIEELGDKCQIKTNVEIHALRYNGMKTSVYSGNQEWTFDKCILCVTRNVLRSIRGLEVNPHIRNVLSTSISRPLHRIYARFPLSDNGQSWFDNLPRITTNNVIGYMIPINPKHGLIMISYTDGQIARLWNFFKKNGILQESIMKHVRQMFPKKSIPDPLWMDSWYWEEGAHYWQLQKTNGYKKYTPTKDQITAFGYVLGGEVVSRNHQAWIEGAIESVDHALKVIYSM